MIAFQKAADWISAEEYLEGERSAEVRHEYVDGRAYAMAGASDDHNRIAGNIFRELGNALRGHKCEPFINDMKVKILVEQERMAATILHRAEPGWQSNVIEGSGSILKLPGIGVEIPLERNYERTTIAGARASGG